MTNPVNRVKSTACIYNIVASNKAERMCLRLAWSTFMPPLVSIAYDLTYWLNNVKVGDGIASKKLFAVSDSLSRRGFKQKWKRKRFGVGKKFRYPIMQSAK